MHEKLENIRQNNWKTHRCSCRCRSWAQGERSPFVNCCCHLTTFQIDPPNCSSWNSVWKNKKQENWLNDWHLAYSSAHLFPWQIFLTWQTITWVLTRKKFKRFSTFGAHKLPTKLRKKVVKCLHFLFNSDEKKNRA